MHAAHADTDAGLAYGGDVEADAIVFYAEYQAVALGLL